MECLIVIDYTNDFIDDNGALTCGENGKAIEEKIMELVKTFNKRQDYVIFAIDKHERDDVYHPETKLYPPHNIEDTQGRVLYGKLEQYAKAHPECYQMAKRRYSAFSGTELDHRLRERHIEVIHLCGVCTDICVLHTAIDAYELGYKIVIHEKAVASFNEDGHRFALDHFEKVLGATIERG
ncbi:cysteine hydrolase [Carnobacteriaceae bacterium zg-ZUI78]|nr:cysteine hydrolase [Carnobacteriaceae bacterium zg-ZUI78]